MRCFLSLSGSNVQKSDALRERWAKSCRSLGSWSIPRLLPGEHDDAVGQSPYTVCRSLDVIWVTLALAVFLLPGVNDIEAPHIQKAIFWHLGFVERWAP